MLSFLLSELSVHEALYYEFYNYSTRPEVRLYAEGEKYYALVKFKKYMFFVDLS